jgi:hypothetical protein
MGEVGKQVIGLLNSNLPDANKNVLLNKAIDVQLQAYKSLSTTLDKFIQNIGRMPSTLKA